MISANTAVVLPHANRLLRLQQPFNASTIAAQHGVASCVRVVSRPCTRLSTNKCGRERFAFRLASSQRCVPAARTRMGSAQTFCALAQLLTSYNSAPRFGGSFERFVHPVATTLCRRLDASAGLARPSLRSIRPCASLSPAPSASPAF